VDLRPVREHARIGLGLGAGDAAGGASRAESAAEPPARSGVDRVLHDALAARDLGLGLGRASVLVSAARAAASSPRAPELGATTFAIECDATGTVRTAHADDRAWAAEGDALIHAMRARAAARRERDPSQTRSRIVAIP